MQRVESDDEYWDAGLRSNPLIANPVNRRRGQAVHAPKRSNPFASLPIPAGATERERVLTDDEIDRIWNATGTPYPWGPLFRLLLLTLARREEVAGMRWSEISPDLTTWAIPSARMKRKSRMSWRSLPRRATYW